MVDKERRKLEDEKAGMSVEGGYTIFLDEETISAFMESGDLSSASQLDHFKDIGVEVEKRMKEGKGFSLLALSATGNRISRDFAVLQFAHTLAKHGKSVLIVDCDFLSPGLSGLVEDMDKHGFLDLLLYGSSLKSIIHSIGIDGVSVTGSGSFPVSRTIPFAHKEFNKAKRLLSEKSDLVIYCSTLYTDDKAVNPLCNLVDGVMLCCRIEEMKEGQLKKNLEDLGSDVPPVDLVCFCGGKKAVPAPEGGRRERKAPVEETVPDVTEEHEEREEPTYIEKTEEIETAESTGGGGVNLPRLITISAAVVIVGFLAWWVIINRSIKEKESTRKMTELVQKQRDAREAVDRKEAGAGTVDTVAEKESAGAKVVETVSAEGGETRAPIEVKKPLKVYYTIHVHSFLEIERAEKAIEYLEGIGYEVSVVEKVIMGETWLRVYVGNFKTREDASQVRNELLALKRIGSARVVKLKD